jgi:hypothetical protein
MFQTRAPFTHHVLPTIDHRKQRSTLPLAMITRSLLLLLLGHDLLLTSSSFQVVRHSGCPLVRVAPRSPPHVIVGGTTALPSTFASDRSEYYGDDETGGSGGGEDDTDYDDSPWRNRYDDEDDEEGGGGIRMYDEDEVGDVETEELQPVPPSKNAGNTFLAFVWDRLMHPDPSDVVEMHEQRVALTEEHVMYIRKRNLYNATFNTDSMVDIPFSYQV